MHNGGMIKKLKDNYWFQCAVEAYKSFCIGATTAYLGLWALISLFRLFV
jgi:hypothetical protein